VLLYLIYVACQSVVVLMILPCVTDLFLINVLICYVTSFFVVIYPMDFVLQFMRVTFDLLLYIRPGSS
jgi:hypothetical protein